jgi:predicted AlkP superfamily pyrophosphatase or phosphodiesterase
LNRLFRRQNWIAVKDELGLELLDCGASRAFAVADHQVAHIYLNDPSLKEAARDFIAQQPGFQAVLGDYEKAASGLDHPRAGDLIAVAQPNAWFTYYYWLDDAQAPDFARTVDIHRKPGFDPAELFLDPNLRAVKWRIFWRLLQKRLGFRILMDVIPLEAELVRGSHGAPHPDAGAEPVLISEQPGLFSRPQIDSIEVCRVILRALGGDGSSDV